MSAETGAGLAFGHKVVAAVAMLMTPLAVFALGIKAAPLDERDPHGDLVRRIVGCMLTGAVIAFTAMVIMVQLTPWVFPGAAQVLMMFGMPGALGPFIVFWVFLVLGSIPGWFLLGPVFQWFADRRNSKLDQIARDMDALRREVQGDRNG